MLLLLMLLLLLQVMVILTATADLSEMIRLWNSPNNPSYVAPATGGRLHAS